MNSAMEQTRYWMWARRKLNTRPPLFSSPMIPAVSATSCEEQAFAEDSAGLLGGCVWPPRSYSCSFCRREFRSAQALGGHMNVHRRDRARLKQSSSSTDESPEQYPDHVSTQEYYNPNPNPNSGVIVSTLSSESEKRNESLLLAPRPLTNPIPVRIPSALELKLELGNSKVRNKGKRDLEEDDEIVCSNKRQRSDAVHLVGRSEVLKLIPSPVEELDLELRLGDSPNIK